MIFYQNLILLLVFLFINKFYIAEEEEIYLKGYFRSNSSYY